VGTEAIIKDILHGSTIESKNGHNICSIELQETLVEHRWIALSLHQVEDV